MTTNDDSGPAFPQRDITGRELHPGMTLRQWYAGLAMQGLLANGLFLKEAGHMLERTRPKDSIDGLLEVVMAKAAAGFIDALLAELKK